MAMISCHECGKQISNQAEVCPYCGCPVNAVSNEFKNKKKKYFTFGAAMAAMGSGVALIAYLIMLYLDGRFYDYAHTYNFFQSPLYLSPFELMMWIVLLAGVFIALMGCSYLYRWSKMKNL